MRDNPSSSDKRARSRSESLENMIAEEILEIHDMKEKCWATLPWVTL